MRVTAPILLALAFLSLTNAESTTLDAHPTIGRVITMLENLVSEIDAEETQDQKDLDDFKAWFARESAATSASVATLKTTIEDTTATIAELSSQKTSLVAEVQRLDGEVSTCQGQIDAATEKRQEENQAYIKEQQDFANAIAACGKAVEILQKHYGDGSTQELEKPAWLSLLNTEFGKLHAVFAHHEPMRQAAATVVAAKAGAAKGGKQVLGLLEKMKQPVTGVSMSNAYVAKTDDALSIVDQVKLLGQTFADDKQSGVDEENRLQGTYDGLMTEKRAVLADLTGQRDTQQGQLNQVNQQLGENQGALATAQSTLTDETAYLNTITEQNTQTIQIYGQRKKDRADEKEAVEEALKILKPDAFLSLKKSVKRDANVKGHMRAAQKLAKANSFCPNCARAAALLRKAATTFHSQVLSAATAFAMGSDALDNVVSSLRQLTSRIDQEAATEAEHKTWCEGEITATTQKKTTYESSVETLGQTIASTQELISMKETSISSTENQLKELDAGQKMLTEIRDECHALYLQNVQDHNDAITALNEAIDLLTKFYKSKGVTDLGLVQKGQQAPKEDAPEMQGDYEMKGVAKLKSMKLIRGIMVDTRNEFESSRKHLDEGETEELTTYQKATQEYRQSRTDLLSAKDRLTVEKQTAEGVLNQAEMDLTSHQGEVAAAKAYLGQLSHSCDTLIKNFPERERLREEEKKAINEAIEVLQAA